MPATHPIVDELKMLLGSRDDLKTALRTAISTADLPQYFSDLDSFYDFVAKTVVQVPEYSDQMMQMDVAFYYLVDISPDRILATDKEFQDWTRDYTNAWADFLDSEASLGNLSTYTGDKAFRIGDYQQGPSGWRSFNQFFARQTRPGKRPLAKPEDPRTVLSPCDFTIMSPPNPVSGDATVTVKGVTLPISELLQDCDHKDAFDGGLMLSGILEIFDYHRYHTPVAGEVVELRKIPGQIGLAVERDGNTLKPYLQPGFQFTQDRGLMILESPVMGLVGLLPVGMAQISSVNLPAEVGAQLYRGEEFGYFQFGGSNMLMLTQKNRFQFDESIVGKHVLQGS
ncbi:MAG: phosphatidylserine decarboxylase, partial [Rhodothermales bacterium]|nr:phosphatidylserine decarboxylase [Rhodothermales bacterium]